MYKKPGLLPCNILIAGPSLNAQKAMPFKIVGTYHIASAGGRDYIAVGPDDNLYVSHGKQVNIVNKKTGDRVGVK